MESAAAAAEIFTIDFVPEDGTTAAPWTGGSNSGATRSANATNERPSYVSGSSSRKILHGRTRDRRALDQFIGDRSNRMVSWLWQQLNQGQFQQWPLTLHGPSGVGKSKLAMRLALTALEVAVPFHGAGSTDRVLTVDAKDYFRSFRRALEINSVADWRSRFESTPVLLVDDLQHLVDYPDAQHELCEILDRRIELEMPTVFVSSLSPLSSGLLPSLASRLAGGYCCALSAPGRQALLTIIQRLFQIQNTTITAEQADRLLDLGISDIGSINQIIWRWKLEKGSVPFQWETASASLRKLIGAVESSLPPEKVLRATAKQFECSVKDLRGSSRKSNLVRARGVFIWICRTHLKLSFKKIGSLLGNRDHTTIMNGMEKTSGLLNDDRSIHLAVERILQRLGMS